MPRRAVIALLTAMVAVGATVGAGATFGAFTDTTDNPGSTFSAASSFGPRFVRMLGGTACGPTTSTATVTGSPVAAGRTVVVLIGSRGSGGYPTASDSRGNVYTTDVVETDGDLRVAALRTTVTTTLSVGDTVTASYPAANSAAMGALELADTSGTDGTGTDQGVGASPSLSVATSRPRGLLIGLVSLRDIHSTTDPGGWSLLGDYETPCGSDPTDDASFHAAYRLTSSAGTFGYAPTFTSTGYAAGLVAYRR